MSEAQELPKETLLVRALLGGLAALALLRKVHSAAAIAKIVSTKETP